jgi:Tyrosine phosphatase family
LIGALNAYRVIPFEQADSYRELFRLLVAGRVPLLFNCTAGKDRTGVAAALILQALGVSRGTIERAYSFTELAIEKLVKILLSDARYAPLGLVSAKSRHSALCFSINLVSDNSSRARAASSTSGLASITALGNWPAASPPPNPTANADLRFLASLVCVVASQLRYGLKNAAMSPIKA